MSMAPTDPKNSTCDFFTIFKKLTRAIALITDIAKPQYGRSIGDDGYRVPYDVKVNPACAPSTNRSEFTFQA